ncbi:ABC transporter permease subunit [Citricoccus nitrophenolicus]|uniref:ABC transporter permease subunit n=1 Tax=Citricoccus nitrophenolicus TaxID=863575 RepID=A0ABV0IFZ9_9MICC
MTVTDIQRAPARAPAGPHARSRRPRGTRLGGIGIIPWRILVFAAGVALWYLVHASGVFPAALLPSPIGVLTEWAQALASASFWSILGDTLAGALVGLAFGIVAGIPLGILTGRFVAAELSVRFLVDFGRAFPAVALVAVLLLILGRGIEVKVVLVFVAVVFIIILQTQHGVRSVSASIVDTTHAFRIRGRLFVRKVLLPSAAPSILAGLRLAASVAVLVTISTEVLTGAPGLGASIAEAQVGGNSALAYAYIVYAGLLGYAVNMGLGWIQGRLLRWQPQGSGD